MSRLGAEPGPEHAGLSLAERIARSDRARHRSGRKPRLELDCFGSLQDSLGDGDADAVTGKSKSERNRADNDEEFFLFHFSFCSCAM